MYLGICGGGEVRQERGGDEMRYRGEIEPGKGWGPRDKGSQHQGSPFPISDSPDFRLGARVLGGTSPSSPTPALPHKPGSLPVAPLLAPPPSHPCERAPWQGGRWGGIPGTWGR